MVHVNATPLLFKTITDKLFQKRIDYHVPLQDVSPSLGEAEGDAFTFEEENAIRYAAGYVFRALRKKILKSAYPQSQKEQLSDIVEDLLQNDDQDQDDSAEHDISCKWMAIVDRGGLIHISDNLFRVFIAIELEIRRHFRVENAQEMMASYEGKVVASILTNEDVLFHWCMVCCDVPEELSNELLKRIVELWSTIRGFSFAKSYVEMYKQATKKILQCSKARTSSQPLPR